MLYIGAAIKNSAFHAEMEKAKAAGDLLVGSVSTQVSHHARCPVVIVPAEDRG